jgi:glycosyltransferase involved in cell wall biosynthesis
VCIVAYDFPPHGAIGTMRTLRLVRHLFDAGWRITVVTGEPSTYWPDTPVEPTLLERVPETVRVLRARPRRRLGNPPPPARVGDSANGGRRGLPSRRRLAPAWVRRAKDWVDFAFRIPDRERDWIGPAVAVARAAWSADGPPDLLFSSAPPWSGQVVALRLARTCSIPWVADFRDPWARAPWREDRPRYTKWAARHLERRVVRRADAVVFTTQANCEEFAVHYGAAAAARFHVIPNGCDPSEFDGIEAVPEAGRFVLLHAGSLYGGRNPLPLCQVLARLFAEGKLDRTTFRLRLLGPVNPSGIDVRAACDRLGLGDVVEIAGRVPRKESLRQMLSASALLLLQPGHTVSVPGKLYEYLAAGRPILAIAEEGEIADLVRASGIGRSVMPSDYEGIAAALLDVVRLASESRARPDPALFDGRLHAARMGRLLGSVLRGTTAPLVSGNVARACVETPPKIGTWES